MMYFLHPDKHTALQKVVQRRRKPRKPRLDLQELAKQMYYERVMGERPRSQ